MHIRVCNECINVLRFCDEARTGVRSVVSSSRQSKLIGFFQRSTDQQLKPPDKTSLLQRDPFHVNENCTRLSAVSSERLPTEVCFVDFPY